MNAEQKLKKIIGSKLSQAGINSSQATDEMLKLFRKYFNTPDEKKAAVYMAGEERIKNLLAAPQAETTASASPKKALRFKATVE